MQGKSHTLRIVFSVTNCICFDQRVQKMARVVSDMCTEVTIAGRKKAECCKKNIVPFKTKRFKIVFKKGFFFYMFFDIRLFFYLLFHRFDLLVANDLDTLLPNFLVSKIKKIPVVYDSHEYFTDLPEITNRKFVKFVWASIEKWIFPHLKYVLTVNDSIANLYETKYSIRPVVVRNCSPLSSGIKALSRNEIGVNENSFIVILQGTGINIDRGAEELIRAVSEMENVTLIIAGSGDVVPALKDMTVKLKAEDRIMFIPPLPWEELMRYTKLADAGMVLGKDTNINYRFSLPNKLFDYISAGIPVIASNLEEITNIVTKYCCGIVLPELTSEEISDTIKILSDNKQLLLLLKENSLKATEELNWEKESEKVKAFYSDLIKNEF